MKIKTAASLAIASALVVTFLVPRLTEEIDTVIVSKTFVKGNDYLVYTDKGTYKVGDTLAYFRYNSSDVWGKFKPNTRYKITHTGFRVGFLSMYENIVEFKQIK